MGILIPINPLIPPFLVSGKFSLTIPTELEKKKKKKTRKRRKKKNIASLQEGNKETSERVEVVNESNN